MDWNATFQGATNLWRNWIRIKTIQSIQDNATLLIRWGSLPVFPTQVIQMFQLNITFWLFDKCLQRMCKTHLPIKFFQNNRALSKVWFISIALKLSSVILRKFCSISSERGTCANTQFSREHSWSLKKNKYYETCFLWNFVAKTGIQQKNLNSWNGYLHKLGITLYTIQDLVMVKPILLNLIMELNWMALLLKVTHREKFWIHDTYLISVLFYRHQLPMSRW